VPDAAKAADAVLAGLGLAGTMALMGAVEPKIGMKLFVPPMMASGVIFFSPNTPPSPKGFLSGTTGCASVSFGLLSLLKGAGVSPVAAQGCAAGALLVWYKATSCVFPPAAVLCVLMSGVPAGASRLDFVASPWLAGHACLYVAACSVSIAREQVRQGFNRQRLHGALQCMSTQSTEQELREIFGRFDTSRDGSLDASELKLALRVALSADLSMAECKTLIQSLDEDGTDTLDFNEFKEIVNERAAWRRAAAGHKRGKSKSV
jgi:CBS-domain-containing membrane protein